jgi:hypothetical protein
VGTQTLLNIGFVCAGVFGGWWMKIIWDSIQSLKIDMKQLDTKMHEDFVRRDDFKDSINSLREDMKEGFKETKEMISMLFKRVDNKVDK